jgi:hypothetical protein
LGESLQSFYKDKVLILTNISPHAFPDLIYRKNSFKTLLKKGCSLIFILLSNNVYFFTCNPTALAFEIIYKDKSEPSPTLVSFILKDETMQIA